MTARHRDDEIPYSTQAYHAVCQASGEAGYSSCLARLMSLPELESRWKVEGEDGAIFEGSIEAKQLCKMFDAPTPPGEAWVRVLSFFSDRIHVSDKTLDEMIQIVKHDHRDVTLREGLTDFKEGLGDPISRVPVRLFDQDMIHPAGVLDLPTMIEAGKTRSLEQSEFSNPKRLEWWLKHIGFRFLAKWLDAFKAVPDEEIADAGQGINRALEKYYHIAHLIPNEVAAEGAAWHDRERFPPSLAKELVPYFDELFVRLERRPPARNLLWMCARFGYLAFANNTLALDLDRRKKLVQQAADEIGKLRKLTREAKSPEVQAEAESRRILYDDLLTFICTFGSIWTGLKPLVLALRSLTEACVRPDLWYWSEDERVKTPFWAWLPNFAAGVVHRHAVLEQEQDPELRSLRADFADFCIERLKKVKDGEYLEPSAAWRYGYVRALQDLHINHRGRSHHALYHAKENDPDPKVREAAEAAYTEVKHSEDLPENRSPRRAIIGALFWLRRSHFIELEGEEKLDATGALRTRNRESRRTDLGKEARKKGM